MFARRKVIKMLSNYRVNLCQYAWNLRRGIPTRRCEDVDTRMCVNVHTFVRWMRSCEVKNTQKSPRIRETYFVVVAVGWHRKMRSRCYVEGELVCGLCFSMDQTKILEKGRHSESLLRDDWGWLIRRVGTPHFPQLRNVSVFSVISI